MTELTVKIACLRCSLLIKSIVLNYSALTGFYMYLLYDIYIYIYLLFLSDICSFIQTVLTVFTHILVV